MGIFSNILSKPIVDAVDAIGNAADKLVTSDEERAKADAFMAMVKQKPYIMQAEINKVNAKFRGFYDNGWRSTLGWVAALGLLQDWVARPFLVAWGFHMPDINTTEHMTLLSALLGIGALSAFKEMKIKSK